MKVIILFGEDVEGIFTILGYMDENMSEHEVIRKINQTYCINLVYDPLDSVRECDVFHNYGSKNVSCLIEELYKFE